MQRYIARRDIYRIQHTKHPQHHTLSAPHPYHRRHVCSPGPEEAHAERRTEGVDQGDEVGEGEGGENELVVQGEEEVEEEVGCEDEDGGDGEARV
jgi:hypothetical protein